MIRAVQVFNKLKVMKMKHDRLMVGMSEDGFPQDVLKATFFTLTNWR